ncbi:MAG: class I SAM-dependent methyltransferase [Candidatus Thorarchaeota archaeon]
MEHHYAKDDWTAADRVQRMANSYRVRYDAEFWNAFNSLVGTQPRLIVADFGCGPGLLLADIARQFNAHTAIALDESEQMLAVAKNNLKNVTNLEKINIQTVNFDIDLIEVNPNSIDLAFSGFMLHEVVSPIEFVTKVNSLMKSDGLYVVYDYISGNEEQFIKTMSLMGMSEEHARKRYPHMCKHSADDIVRILETSGFQDNQSRIINDTRMVVVGLKRSNA